jgi:hypothetical protein
LRHLQVRESGHDRVGVALGQVDEGAAQAMDLGGQRIDASAQPQAHVGGHLVVARATGVQPLAGFAHQCRQPLLDVEMDVLEVDRPGERPVRDLGRDASQPRSISARSCAGRMPAAASIRAWASEPAISAAASRRSNATEAV